MHFSKSETQDYCQVIDIVYTKSTNQKLTGNHIILWLERHFKSLV